MATASRVIDQLRLRQEGAAPAPDNGDNGDTGGPFDTLKQVYQDLRGTSATFAKVDLSTTSREMLERLRNDVQLATLPYTVRRPEDSGVDLVATTDFAEKLNARLQTQLQGVWGTPVPSGAIPNQGDPALLGQFIDRRSGLTANVLVDSGKKEIKVVFGGTTAGLVKSDSFFTRCKDNFVSTLSQWSSNLKVGLGFKAHSLKQAANLTAQVVELVQTDPAYRNQDYTVSTVGHGQGSSEAVFAALSLDVPLKATGFSSADLSGRLVRGLPEANVARAKELVSHVHVRGDIVPNLRWVMHHMRPLGQESVVPALGAAGPLSRNDEFATHITAHLNTLLAGLPQAQAQAQPDQIGGQ
ncbi:MAG: hypothetical protein QM527_01820 [Alphaproteobacteria bacterium]|nr:hypothetical protein [Alphaproteobacteria bacterium]